MASLLKSTVSVVAVKRYKLQPEVYKIKPVNIY